MNSNTAECPSDKALCSVLQPLLVAASSAIEQDPFEARATMLTHEIVHTAKVGSIARQLPHLVAYFTLNLLAFYQPVPLECFFDKA